MKSLPVPKEEMDARIEVHRANAWRDMPPDKLAFAYAWVESMDHVKAAREIGMDGKGLRFMRDPMVRALIAELKEAVEDRRIITEGYVADKLLEVLPKLSGEEDVALCDRGVCFEGKRFDPGGYLRALELAAKVAGIADKKEITGNIGGNTIFNIDLSGTGQQRKVEEELRKAEEDSVIDEQ